MDITHFESRKRLSDQARQLADHLEKNGAAEAAKGVMLEVARLEEGRFLLAIMGKAKRGKSTLINVLL